MSTSVQESKMTSREDSHGTATIKPLRGREGRAFGERIPGALAYESVACDYQIHTDCQVYAVGTVDCEKGAEGARDVRTLARKQGVPRGLAEKARGV